MSTATWTAPAASSQSADGIARYDAIVVGAGVAGLYQLHRLREMGLKVLALEAGSGVGGTWYWNRYPGARFDSQAEVYQFWISKALYKSWTPSERFPAQPETEQWLNHVADQLDLKKDIQFLTRVTAAHYDEGTGRWDVACESGERFNTQLLVACTGMLSAPLTDRFPGQSSFRGEIHHTGRWPKENVEFKGKRVAVIGTGATGIQVIQTIGPKVDSLTVFARTPQYVVPMRNPKYSQADWNQFADNYDVLKQKVQHTFAGFDYDFGSPPWADLTPEQRNEILEKIWDDGSLSFWVGGFPELFFDRAVNDVVSEFVREKMRARLKHDPELCRLLIPTKDDYGFGTHRVPLENKYLEVYLQDNVEVVDCRATPIESIVPEGIRTADGKVHEVDVIVMAVGFDGATGSLTRMGIHGRGGRSLTQDWGKDLRTSMGLQVHGYPNLFTTGAPLAPAAALCNMPTCLQQQVDWISDLIAHARKEGKNVIEPTAEFEDAWVKHHDELVNQTLVADTVSWYMGSNIDGKPRRLLSYIGGVATYRAKCEEQASTGYPGFQMR